MCLVSPLQRDRVAFLFSVKTSNCLNQCQSTTSTGTERGQKQQERKAASVPSYYFLLSIYIFFTAECIFCIASVIYVCPL